MDIFNYRTIKWINSKVDSFSIFILNTQSKSHSVSYLDMSANIDVLYKYVIFDSQLRHDSMIVVISSDVCSGTLIDGNPVLQVMVAIGYPFRSIRSLISFIYAASN